MINLLEVLAIYLTIGMVVMVVLRWATGGPRAIGEPGELFFLVIAISLWPLIVFVRAIIISREQRLRFFGRPENAALRRTQRLISRPPGKSLRSLSEFLFPAKTFARVFDPVLADMELEYIEALAEGDELKARWVHIRGVLSFWLTFVTYITGSAMGKLVKAFWSA